MMAYACMTHTLMPLATHLSYKCSHPVLSYVAGWYKNTARL